MTVVAQRRWLRGAFFAVWDEWLLFLRTFAGMAQPARFARGWLDGREAMNPIAFAVSCLGIVTLVHQVDWLRAAGEPSPFWARLITQPGPYLHYALIGALAHGFVSLTGRRGAALGDSIAMALFVGGVLSTLIELVIELVIELAVMGIGLKIAGNRAVTSTPLVAWSLLFAALIGFVILLGRALAGAHQVPWWRPTVGVALAFVLTGLPLSFAPGLAPGLFVQWLAAGTDGKMHFAPGIGFLHGLPLF